MTAKEIIRKYLVEHQYDGLYTEDCGCCLDDLLPCDYSPSDCKPGYRHIDPDEGWIVRWIVKGTKKESKHEPK